MEELKEAYEKCRKRKHILKIDGNYITTNYNGYLQHIGKGISSLSASFSMFGLDLNKYLEKLAALI